MNRFRLKDTTETNLSFHGRRTDIIQKTLTMKRSKYIKHSLALMAAAVTLQGCITAGKGSSTNNDAGILGGLLGVVTEQNTIANVITSVIGMDKLTKENLVGTWNYTAPGVAFTSENLLAKAGGEVAASQLKDKLKDTYRSVGIRRENTRIVFGEDNAFSGKIMGKSVRGTYTLDESNGELKMQTLLFTLNGHVKRNGVNGVSLLFESKKLLTVLQALSAMSGNANLDMVGEISKNYDGVRIGFDMNR